MQVHQQGSIHSSRPITIIFSNLSFQVSNIAARQLTQLSRQTFSTSPKATISSILLYTGYNVSCLLSQTHS